MVADVRSEQLSVRLGGLASALRTAGVDPELAARLLASASAATLDAVALELMLEQRAAEQPSRGLKQPVRLAS